MRSCMCYVFRMLYLVKGNMLLLYFYPPAERIIFETYEFLVVKFRFDQMEFKRSVLKMMFVKESFLVMSSILIALFFIMTVIVRESRLLPIVNLMKALMIFLLK